MLTRILIVMQTTLTICLLYCLTSAVRLGRALKSNCKNCSCKNCSCAGHDRQIICQPVTPDVVHYVYTQTYTYTHMQKHKKKVNVRGYEKLPWNYRQIVGDQRKYPFNAKLNKALSGDKGRNYHASRVTHPVYESIQMLCRCAYQ